MTAHEHSNTWNEDPFAVLGRVNNDFELIERAVIATTAGFALHGRAATEDDRACAGHWVLHVMVAAEMLRRVVDGRSLIAGFDDDEQPLFMPAPRDKEATA